MSTTTSDLDQGFKQDIVSTCILLSVERQLKDARDDRLGLLEIFNALDNEDVEKILKEASEKSQASLDETGISFKLLPFANIVDTVAYHFIECMQRRLGQKK